MHALPKFTFQQLLLTAPCRGPSVQQRDDRPDRSHCNAACGSHGLDRRTLRNAVFTTCEDHPEKTLDADVTAAALEERDL